MENTWKKRLRGSGEHGGGMSWGHDPLLSGSVVVQGSGGPFVHRPPSFHWQCWLQRLHFTSC